MHPNGACVAQNERARCVRRAIPRCVGLQRHAIVVLAWMARSHSSCSPRVPRTPWRIAPAGHAAIFVRVIFWVPVGRARIGRVRIVWVRRRRSRHESDRAIHASTTSAFASSERARRERSRHPCEHDNSVPLKACGRKRWGYRRDNASSGAPLSFRLRRSPGRRPLARRFSSGETRRSSSGYDTVRVPVGRVRIVWVRYRPGTRSAGDPDDLRAGYGIVVLAPNDADHSSCSPIVRFSAVCYGVGSVSWAMRASSDRS
jgi:hypothetical protein